MIDRDHSLSQGLMIQSLIGNGQVPRFHEFRIWKDAFILNDLPFLVNGIQV